MKIMSSLYGLLFFMIVSALYLLIIPFVKKRAPWRVFFFLAGAFVVSAFSLYHLSGNKKELANWLAEGKKHYQLQSTFEQLGGVDGAIVRIKSKLAEKPNDTTGWLILAKLYLAKNDKANANDAFNKAKELQASAIKKEGSN
jgi:cytochrome c-type biogenesis protein CcmH/NrfG